MLEILGWIILSLFLVIKFSDIFIDNSVYIAKNLGVSEFIIGLTLVSVGTSAPELVSSVVASFYNSGGLALGNVVGSNIANMCLIIGIAALVKPLVTHSQMLRRDGYVMIFSLLLFYYFALDGLLSKTEGIILLMFFGGYVIYLFETRSAFKKKEGLKAFLDYVIKAEYLGAFTRKRKNGNGLGFFSKNNLTKLGIVLLSGVAIVFSANILVDNAIKLSQILGVSENLIGLTLIAFGTSVPELTVSLSAAKKNLGDIVVGNIIGSNIANVFLVIGASAFVNALPVIKLALDFSMPFLIVTSVIFLIFVKLDWEIRRIEALALLLFYLLFLYFEVLLNLGL